MPSELDTKNAEILAETTGLDSEFKVLQVELEEITKKLRELLFVAKKQGDKQKIAEIEKQLGL